MDEPVVTYQPVGGVKVDLTDPANDQQAWGNWSRAGIPRGLEYLASLNRVDIYQVLHVLEVVTGWEKNNQYQICNEQHQQFMLAQEETDCCTRQMCKSARDFRMELRNMQGEALIALDRPLRCQGCCCPCCLQEMEIQCPPGNKIASIHEVWTCWTPRYVIRDVHGEEIFRIEGECCYCKCCTDVFFRIFRTDGSEAGEIVKHWAGWREVCGQVNDFSVIFGAGENILNKAILLGSTFLVDFMYFEYSN